VIEVADGDTGHGGAPVAEKHLIVIIECIAINDYNQARMGSATGASKGRQWSDTVLRLQAGRTSGWNHGAALARLFYLLEYSGVRSNNPR
ncbi:MAG: hypothetical protein EBW19_06970, partial [Betaproteobacteria bacterium]|nr:hypothetical protein [Betaproteobacteria bacterium]